MGTHGSMTKAGKVRKQTPKLPAKNRKNYPPRLKNRLKYEVRIEKVASPRA
ncbi:MAG: 30S ribosomal protein S30e [Aeropyrum sp.]|nr:30S ribosomal protein S30e [Aeropyrum sp.]MCE4616302.1 30S ribosomal protein S30e [Aeropyrum sp.]